MNYLRKSLSIILFIIAAQFIQAQSLKVSGVVTASDDKLPMMGVNVVLEGIPGQGTVTDLNGKFSIVVPQGKNLVFKYIGYKEKTVSIKQNEIVNVVLEPDSKVL